MNRKIPVICAAMILISFVLVVFTSYLPQKNALADEQKYVYLTFDDGPSDRVTPEILDVLKRESVPATFFIVGVNAKSRKEILKRAADEGHTLAVHSYSHKYSEIYASAESLLKDIGACNEVIKSVTGEYTDLYRFPGGSFTVAPELIDAVTAKGYRYIDWNASFRDSEIACATADELFNAAITTVAYPQNVVLLAHDSTTKSATAQALPSVIKYYKDAGYTFKKF